MHGNTYLTQVQLTRRSSDKYKIKNNILYLEMDNLLVTQESCKF